MPNIKDLKNPVVKEELPSLNPESILETPFTLEEFTAFWNTYAEQFKQNGLQSEYLIMSNRALTLDDKFCIHFKLENHLQLDLLNNLKSDLLEFLRKNLKNARIMLEASVTEGPQTKKIYTTHDKLQHLSEKYPMIQELRTRLGLDTEY